MSIKSKLEDLVNETIAELNVGGYTDEILCDMCQDQEYIDEAIDYLIEKLEEIRKG